MARASLTGTRIRERRIALGLRQGGLAEAVGISPSYLNLIEHNRRRIGGKLVHALAKELKVDPQALTEGAQARLVDALREAAAGHGGATGALDQLEDLANRFPAWAELLVDTARRARDLERTVEVLSDRMTHDPFLSTSVHEVLSTVTAIRATAAILVETPDIDAGWRHRFHRNLEEESGRLTESAEALVRFFDTQGDGDAHGSTPSEEFDAWLHGVGHHIPALEGETARGPDFVLKIAADLPSRASHSLATQHLAQYAQDAAAMPLQKILPLVKRLGCDPEALAAQFDVDLSMMLRRLAALPAASLGGDIGLVRCDGSGTLTFRKPIEGFELPRHSAACPLWPLYEALAHPLRPIRRLVATPGRSAAEFVTFATCRPREATGFNQPPILEALMLIVPRDLASDALTEPEQLVGISCRICPRSACNARREPSLITETATPDAASF